MNRKPIFDAVRQIRKNAAFTPYEVDLLDDAIDLALGINGPVQSSGRRPSKKAIDLIHSFESLKLTAYKDPGSSNGLPITNGWGSTADLNGKPIKLGAVWNKEYADAVFARDIEKRVGWLNDLLVGVPTAQHEYDALFSFMYNVGTNALRNSTLLRLHKQGDRLGAARQFLRWDRNDGKIMRGLTRRREAESKLYRGEG